MRKWQFLLCFGLFAFLFCSCGDLQFEVGGSGGSGNVNKPVNTPPKKFWAQNTSNLSFYQVEAELKAESKNCKVWVEKESGVSDATASSMAKAYEDVILPKMLNTYGIKKPVAYEGQIVANNTMELADWLGDGDGKLCILLLDIKDDYDPNGNASYVGGYFWGANFVDMKNSNLCDMIYIDT